jgi:RNA polymerase sigma-70 factor (ECF subfamily)
MTTIEMSKHNFLSDEALAKMTQDGNRVAFETLCDRHLPNVYSRLRALLPAEAVEDVTQEVFMAALRGIRDYRGNSLFRTWLAAIIRHKVADFYRQRSRQPEVVPIADDGDDPIAPDNWEERALVQAALQRLPAHYQEVLLLRFAEGKPFDQIAGALGISLEATKSRYRRAVAAVAQGIGLEPVRLKSREDLP